MKKVQVETWFAKYKKNCNRSVLNRPSISLMEFICDWMQKHTHHIRSCGKCWSLLLQQNFNILSRNKCSWPSNTCDGKLVIHKMKLLGKGWTNGALLYSLVRMSQKGYINKFL